jgi:5-methylcytosine-specific restriction protein A
MQTNKQFRNSKVWLTKRKHILIRDKYKCQECKKYLMNVEARHVHHIIAINDNWDKRLDNDNLISLCLACHNKVENNWRK